MQCGLRVVFFQQAVMGCHWKRTPWAQGLSLLCADGSFHGAWKVDSEKQRNFIFRLWDTFGVRAEVGLHSRVVQRNHKCLWRRNVLPLCGHPKDATTHGMLLPWPRFLFGFLRNPSDTFVLKTWPLWCCNALSLSSTSRSQMLKWFQRRIYFVSAAPALFPRGSC